MVGAIAKKTTPTLEEFLEQPETLELTVDQVFAWLHL